MGTPLSWTLRDYAEPLCSGRCLEKAGSWKLTSHGWTFSYTAQPLTFRHTILKDTLLPHRNSGYCQNHLLFLKIKWKMHFWEEKRTCLCNCIDLGFSRCAFFNWKFCLETDFSSPSLLSTFKMGKIGTLLSKHFNKNNSQGEICMKSLFLLFYIFLFSH